MKNRFFKKCTSKSLNSFYSVPVKETAQKQKMYQNWLDNAQI